MEVIEIPPSDLEIDPLNERNENVGPHKNNESLEESIKEQGLIQPPVARRDNGGYKVVVGQRRTLAAQSVGLDRIPVIVVDWDDGEALQASITENVDAFQKAVSKTDRAAALEKLMEINNWHPQDAAEELGVSTTTIRSWLERTRDEWQDTSVHVDSADDNTEETEAEVETHSSNSTGLSKEEVESIPDSELTTIRSATDSPEEREEVVEKVVEGDLSSREIREAKKLAERGEGSFSETVEQVGKEKDDEPSGSVKVETRVTFTGDYAVGLRDAARDYGTSEEQVVKGAIKDYLTDEGYI